MFKKGNIQYVAFYLYLLIIEVISVGYSDICRSLFHKILIFEYSSLLTNLISEYPNTKYSQYPSNIRRISVNIRQIPITITIHHSCNILILFNIKHYFITTIKDNFYFQRIFYIIQVFFKLFVQKELD